MQSSEQPFQLFRYCWGLDEHIFKNCLSTVKDRPAVAFVTVDQPRGNPRRFSGTARALYILSRSDGKDIIYGHYIGRGGDSGRDLLDIVNTAFAVVGVKVPVFHFEVDYAKVHEQWQKNRRRDT